MFTSQSENALQETQGTRCNQEINFKQLWEKLELSGLSNNSRNWLTPTHTECITIQKVVQVLTDSVGRLSKGCLYDSPSLYTKNNQHSMSFT
jgi:hypothetical protein